MDKQTAEREELYRKVSQPGERIPINVEPFDLDDLNPEDVEIGLMAAGLKNSRAGGERRGMSRAYKNMAS